MPPNSTLKDNVKEGLLFRSRALVALVFVGMLVTGMVWRLTHLQVVEFEHFTTLAEGNRVKVVPVPPTRGLIFDRNGEVLAENIPTFTLELIPEAVKDVNGTIDSLSSIVSITEADRARFRSLLRSSRRFEHVPVRLRLSEEEVARFSVNRHRFPGVDVKARLSRNYPHGDLFAHLLGYVGRINEKELKRLDSARYRGTKHVGKTGVELAYEDQLHGEVGYHHVETNAQGRVLRVLERHDPRPGHNVHLHVDVALQRSAIASLGAERGAIVALDPLTGGVLAFVSQPGFDPNAFVDGIDSKSYRALLESRDRPLFNRALNGQYPPGSTVKPFIGLAGLELDIAPGSARRDGTIWCGGYFSLPGKEHRYRDWKRSGHGRVGLESSIIESCDVYYYELALAMGIDELHRFMGRFGFGRRTGVDLIGESSGLNPSREWKRSARRRPWYPGETLITGIGQGFTLATPLQLAQSTSILANRGVRVPPRVMLRTEAPLGEKDAAPPVPALGRLTLADPANWERVIGAMRDVVHGKKGTARQVSKDINYVMAGKTGTAQVFTIPQDGEYNAEELEKRLQDHALFVSFAPLSRPRIVVAVLVENGGSGSRTAAPVARKVIDRFFEIEGLERPEDGDLLLSLQAHHDHPSAPGTHR